MNSWFDLFIEWRYGCEVHRDGKKEVIGAVMV